MGVLDNIFGGDKGRAIPGGNVTKPLMIALLALLASRYMSSGGQKEVSPSPRQDTSPLPSSIPEEIARAVSLGQSRRIAKQFQQAGLRRSGRFLDQHRTQQNCRTWADCRRAWS